MHKQCLYLFPAAGSTNISAASHNVPRVCDHAHQPDEGSDSRVCAVNVLQHLRAVVRALAMRSDADVARHARASIDKLNERHSRFGDHVGATWHAEALDAVCHPKQGIFLLPWGSLALQALAHSTTTVELVCRMQANACLASLVRTKLTTAPSTVLIRLSRQRSKSLPGPATPVTQDPKGCRHDTFRHAVQFRT